MFTFTLEYNSMGGIAIDDATGQQRTRRYHGGTEVGWSQVSTLGSSKQAAVESASKQQQAAASASSVCHLLSVHVIARKPSLDYIETVTKVSPEDVFINFMSYLDYPSLTACAAVKMLHCGYSDVTLMLHCDPLHSISFFCH
jgi:hypothetical protein